MSQVSTEIYRVDYSILSPESQSFFGKINVSVEKLPKRLAFFRESCIMKSRKFGKERFCFMKAVITVTGKDSMGIIAAVSALCTDCGANIIDISQTVMQEYFAMIMLVDLEKMDVPFGAFSDELDRLASANGLKIHAMHEDVFNSMHRI